jgi:hypothetical protein
MRRRRLTTNRLESKKLPHSSGRAATLEAGENGYFLDADFLVDFLDDLRDDERLREADFFAGTLPPSLRASAKPIAIACFLLFTFLPDRPLLSVPRLRSCIAFSTFFCAFLPYFAMCTSD